MKKRAGSPGDWDVTLQLLWTGKIVKLKSGRHVTLRDTNHTLINNSNLKMTNMNLLAFRSSSMTNSFNTRVKSSHVGTTGISKSKDWYVFFLFFGAPRNSRRFQWESSVTGTDRGDDAWRSVSEWRISEADSRWEIRQRRSKVGDRCMTKTGERCGDRCAYGAALKQILLLTLLFLMTSGTQTKSDGPHCPTPDGVSRRVPVVVK